MRWYSFLAIYALLWVMSAFVLLPFGVKTPDEVEGHKIARGHATSAPVNFRPGRVAFRATVLAAILLFLFYENYMNGWITVADLNFFGDPPVKDVDY